MVYELVKGSNFALSLTVAQVSTWVKTLVDGLSIDMTTAEQLARGQIGMQKDAEGCKGVQRGAIGCDLGCRRMRKDAIQIG
jgi:hypothetical protein